jgi:hypothetical protein
MTNLMIRIVTLATCSIALIAAFSFTPVVAAGGSGGIGGGGEGGATYGGTDQRSAYPPSYYPKRSGSKATHVPKGKKPTSPFSTTPLLPRVTAKPMRPSMTAMNMPRPSSS